MLKALVIGGSSGVAAPIIQRLVDLDYAVDFTFHHNSDAARKIEAKGGAACHAIRLDLGSVSEVRDFLDSIPPAAAPDVLINCAGLLQDGLSLGTIDERLLAAATINFIAPAMICSHIAGLMTARRCGHIVNVTSVAARKPRVGNAIYGSTKAALERFTATLALETARFKVRTLCIAPGFIDTAMFEQFSGQERTDIIRSVPMRQILSPSQVADAVICFITGGLATTGTTLVLGNGELVF